MQEQRQINAPNGGGSVDAEEVAQFSRIAEEWWDPNGKFRPLHQINPVRLAYVKSHLCEHFGRDAQRVDVLSGLSLLDIGCGGGLMCEPLSRLGASVCGVDASEKNIAVARLHSDKSALDIDYQASTAEALAAKGSLFDVVLALEIIEHVVEPEAFMLSCANLVKPGGMLVMSTINRTAKSYAMAIIGAEYVLRMLPRGTHQWRKFVRPSEMARFGETAGLEVVDISGMVLNPLRWQWRIHPSDCDVNYLMVLKKL